jgi:GTP-binding protein YchF
MALKSGIVGLPNVGKSTLFNALTAARALAANYPFATKEPNIGMITVPDPRLEKLAEIIRPKSVVPTNVEIVDIAGLIRGASKGEGLGNQFLGNIREVNAIIHVIRCFDDDNVVHVDGSIDPVRDKEIIDTELLLKDLETVEKNLDKFQKAAKSAKKEDLQNLEFAHKLKAHLEKGMAARDFEPANEHETQSLKNMYLLTSKPVLYVLNVDESSVINGNVHTQRFMESVEGQNAEVILISAGIEAELIEFEDVEERQLFLEEMGLHEPGVNRVIRASYHLLDLITFFTAGPKEVRAWTVRKNSTAPKAAGAIHTDFEKGFIRAEVIKYENYLKYGSEHAVKEAGKMHVEGKEYIVQDGDVIYFRFNV